MADNTTLNAMAGGDVIATDDISGVKVQRVKVGHGADGSYTDASGAAPLPVAVFSDSAVAVSVASAAASVPTPGTAVRLANHAALSVTVRARESNADVIYVGGSDVAAANGYELAPGEAVSMDVGNTDALYIDAAHAGDAVRYLWVAA